MLDARRMRAQEFLFDMWRRIRDGKYGGEGDVQGAVDLEAVTDDVVEGLEEIKYQE